MIFPSTRRLILESGETRLTNRASVELRGFTPLLSFALQNAQKSDSEAMISRGSNPSGPILSFAPPTAKENLRPDVDFRGSGPRSGRCRHLLRRISPRARKESQRVAPNKAPTPAVSAIASAPQKVTRTVALHTGAPPTRAAKEPNIARKKSELPEIAQTSANRGTMRTSRSGRAAPAAKVPAEANAAWTGRALRVSDIPNSSRA